MLGHEPGSGTLQVGTERPTDVTQGLKQEKCKAPEINEPKLVREKLGPIHEQK